VPCLVLPEELAAAAAELRQLPAGGSFRADVLRLVALVLEYLEAEREAVAITAGPARLAAFAAAYPPGAVSRVAAAARWLAALCVRCRWPALLRQLLPAAAAGSDAAAAAAAMDAALAPLGLLAAAAAAGSAPLLAALNDWAVAGGHTWGADGGEEGDGSLTPLHLAAALGPSLAPEAAAALVAALGREEAAEDWGSARAGGWTPQRVAAAAGCAALLRLLGPGATALEADVCAAGTSAAAGAAAAAAPALREEQGEEGELPLKPWKKEQPLDEEAERLAAAAAGAGGKKAGAAAGRLPITAAELEAWQRRPMHPGVLLAVGAAAVLISLGLAAALRVGLYDE
jgi:hypothetical protein